MNYVPYRFTKLVVSQESIFRYQPGGYHPVALGDSFKNSRYTVHHKLGHGGTSTVWLARDERENIWVSLKVMIAEIADSNELQAHEHLAQYGDLSSHYIVRLLDSFLHEGPNGQHQCLVFELLGPTLEKILGEYYEDHDDLDPVTVIKLSSQLLKAAKFLQDAGMCHGDISGRNLAFSGTHLSQMSKSELFEILGQPQIEAPKEIDLATLAPNLPSEIVGTAEWLNWVEENAADLRLLDLGESFFHGEAPEKLAQPGGLRVPETILMTSFDHRVDLWRVGCMIYLFLFKTTPFWYMGEDVPLVRQMIGFVEDLPKELEAQCISMLSEAERDIKSEEVTTPTELEKRFAEKIPNPLLHPFIPIISGLMRFLPADRISLDQAFDMLPVVPEGYDSSVWSTFQDIDNASE